MGCKYYVNIDSIFFPHRQVVRATVQADIWGGGSSTNEHYDRFANDQSIDRFKLLISTNYIYLFQLQYIFSLDTRIAIEINGAKVLMSMELPAEIF